MVDKIVLENNWMLDAKKVRLSLALLPGRVVLFVMIGRAAWELARASASSLASIS